MTSPSETPEERHVAALVEVLRLKPGDIVLVKIPLGSLPPKDRNHYTDQFKQVLRTLLDLGGHDKVQIAIVDKGIDFSVIEAAAELCPPGPPSSSS